MWALGPTDWVGDLPVSLRREGHGRHAEGYFR